MKEMICILCPQGCHLQVDEENDYKVTGNRCEKGILYGKTEAQNPTRVLSSTVRVKSRLYPRCPVKTDAPIPKPLIFDAMALLDCLELDVPVKRGDVVLENILGLNVNFIATRDLEE